MFPTLWMSVLWATEKRARSSAGPTSPSGATVGQECQRALPGSLHPPRASPPSRGCSACLHVSPWHLGWPRGREGPAQCPMSATERTHPAGVSLALRGQVGSKASHVHFFPPIFIFPMVKPWEELGSGSHVEHGRQCGVPGACWVQQGEGLLNKALLILTCGFFYAIPENWGKALFCAQGHVQWGHSRFGALGSLGDTTDGGGGWQISAHWHRTVPFSPSRVAAELLCPMAAPTMVTRPRETKKIFL